MMMAMSGDMNNGMGLMCMMNPTMCQNNPMFLMPVLASNDNMRNLMIGSQLARGGRPNMLMLSGNDKLSALGAAMSMISNKPSSGRSSGSADPQPSSQQSQSSSGSQGSSQGPTPTQ